MTLSTMHPCASIASEAARLILRFRSVLLEPQNSGNCTNDGLQTQGVGKREINEIKHSPDHIITT